MDLVLQIALLMDSIQMSLCADHVLQVVPRVQMGKPAQFVKMVIL